MKKLLLISGVFGLGISASATTVNATHPAKKTQTEISMVAKKQQFATLNSSVNFDQFSKKALAVTAGQLLQAAKDNKSINSMNWDIAVTSKSQNIWNATEKANFDVYGGWNAPQSYKGMKGKPTVNATKHTITAIISKVGKDGHYDSDPIKAVIAFDGTTDYNIKNWKFSQTAQKQDLVIYSHKWHAFLKKYNWQINPLNKIPQYGKNNDSLHYFVEHTTTKLFNKKAPVKSNKFSDLFAPYLYKLRSKYEPFSRGFAPGKEGQDWTKGIPTKDGFKFGISYQLDEDSDPWFKNPYHLGLGLISLFHRSGIRTTDGGNAFRPVWDNIQATED